MISMKRFYASAFALQLVFMFGAHYASAQTPAALRLPRPSQKASVMQTIGVTDLTITYSRPAVKGRKIWGEAPADATAGTATLDDASKREKDAPIVPYGHVWRTGANDATVFSVTDDVLINGQKLPAGTYSLHTIPGKDDWTIIFNKDAGQWGSFTYDDKKDALRVKSKPQWVGDSKEWLEYSIPSVTPNSAQVLIRWEKVAVPFTVEVPDVNEIVQARVDAAMAASPGDEKIALTVARMHAGNDEWDQALMWADRSIKIKETYQNLAFKSQVLVLSGKKDEGLRLADVAIQKGKADKVNTAGLEKFVENVKAGKM